MGFRPTKERDKKPVDWKDKKEEVSGTRNEVHLAGTLQGVWMRDESAFALIDVGRKKFIPVSLFGKDDAELANKLDTFQKGDTIAITGYCNAWSSKIDDQWVNKMDIRITEIRGTGSNKGAVRDGSFGRGADDEIPF